MPLPTITKSTVTITIAAPAVVSWTAHGLTTGTPIGFTTTGALPTGLTTEGSANSIFYVSASGNTANTFQVSTTYVNAVAGTSLTTSGSQSGTHTCSVNTGFYSPQDLTDVSVTFPTSGSHITWTNHNLSPGSLVSFTGTAMPSGVTQNKEYWVAGIIDANTLEVSTGSFPLKNGGYTAKTYTTAGTAVKGRIISRKRFTQNALQVYTTVLSVPITLQNVLTGSQIRFADGSNVQYFNITAPTSTVVQRIKFSGTGYITVRKTGYREYLTPVSVNSATGATAYISQVPDGTA
jgi:hypothetical protein